jgi:hypothetical protein
VRIEFIQRANFWVVMWITGQQKCLWDYTSSVQKQQNRLSHPGGGFFMRCFGGWGISRRLGEGSAKPNATIAIVGFRVALPNLQFAANVFDDAVAQQHFHVHLLNQVVAFFQLEGADDLALVDFLLQFEGLHLLELLEHLVLLL